jgi:3-oxo-5-alpha-steroid 4-dehydrogenase 3
MGIPSPRSEAELWAWSLWFARALWLAGAAACLLAADLPFVGIEALRRISHYGKLRSEVAVVADSGAFLRLQTRLANLSLPPRTVWTAYYAGGAALNTACLVWEPCLLLLLLQVHLLRRVYETGFVTLFSETRREHPLTICVGVFFYALLSPSLALEVRAARLQSVHLHDQHVRELEVDGSGIATWFAMATIAAFLGANVAQHLAHVELARLRASENLPLKMQVGSKAQYGVPTGWLFTHLSCCPHYTCEVVLYVALALLAATDAAGPVGGAGLTIRYGGYNMCACVCGWGAVLFSAINLSITAVRTRKWYRKRPEARHLSRWAIIPFAL